MVIVGVPLVTGGLWGLLFGAPQPPPRWWSIGALVMGLGGLIAGVVLAILLAH
jgi:hypothetical protein